MSSPFVYDGNLEELDAIAAGRLVPPDTANVGNDRVSWTDVVTINEIKLIAPREKPMRNQQPNDVTAEVRIRMTVDPIGGSPKNVGKRLSSTLYFNMSSLARANDGHADMTRRSFAAIYQLAKATGMDPSLAGDLEAFVNEGRPKYTGARISATVEQRKAVGNGGEDRWFEGARDFAALPE